MVPLYHSSVGEGRSVFCKKVSSVAFFLLPVLPGGTAIDVAEDAVEVAQVLIAHGVADGVHVGIRIFQQKGSLGQAFVLDKLRVGLAGLALDLAGQPAFVVVQLPGKFPEAAGGVFCLHILQHMKNGRVLRAVRGQGVGVAAQMEKQQSHGHLGGIAFAEGIIEQDTDEIFCQILELLMMMKAFIKNIEQKKFKMMLYS